LKKTFKDDSDFESMEFSALHRIVLGLANADLEEQLKLDPSLVNTQDKVGRTPLHWACRRGDEEKTEILLSKGANPNLADNEDATPLHHAVADGTARCAELCLEHGADPNAVTVYGTTPIHVAMTMERSQVDTIRALARCGANLNAQDMSGQISFHCAIGNIHIEGPTLMENLMTLKKEGANIDHQDIKGNSAVTKAVGFSDVKCTQCLVNLDARLDLVNKGGDNILHTAATFGNEAIMRTLAEARIDGVDTNLKNNDGLTPKEVFDKTRRSWFREPDENARLAFNMLLESINSHHIEEADEILDLQAGADTMLSKPRQLKSKDFDDKVAHVEEDMEDDDYFADAKSTQTSSSSRSATPQLNHLSGKS
jgi:ankyrin repeat protein